MPFNAALFVSIQAHVGIHVTRIIHKETLIVNDLYMIHLTPNIHRIRRILSTENRGTGL